MMISRDEIGFALSAYRNAQGTRIADRSALSAGARAWSRWSAQRWFAAFGRAALVEPFYRHGRVAELRVRIAEGRYDVPSEEIAEKLLGRLLVDAATG
jgi:anti-sigma28 factor (negative regulator of flagellin synthesis)